MRVLVASDLGEVADATLEAGASLASSPADALAVVHVLPAFLRAQLTRRGGTSATGSIELDRRATDAVHERLRRVAGREAEVFVEHGSDYVEILKCADAWRADVIVVGSHGRSRLAWILGSVAQRIVRNARCCVLAVRHTAGRGWVLAATDLSAPSFAAIAAGAEEARRRGARLKVIHVVGFLDREATYLLQLGSPAIGTARASGEASRILSESVARLGVDAVCATLDGSPAAAIVRDAEVIGAELVVVAARRRTGFTPLAPGGVAERIVRSAPCSVLVVRPGRDTAYGCCDNPPGGAEP